MALPLKLLLSFVIAIASATAGGGAGVGFVLYALRDDYGGPTAYIGLILFGAIGLVIGLVFGAVGIILFWRRVGAPVVSLPPAHGDTAGAVWPPPPSRRP